MGRADVRVRPVLREARMLRRLRVAAATAFPAAAGAAAAKPLPEGPEAEAAARGGASAGALVVSTQI